MPLSETAQKNYTRMFGDFPPPLADSDPEFTRLFLDLRWWRYQARQS